MRTSLLAIIIVTIYVSSVFVNLVISLIPVVASTATADVIRDYSNCTTSYLSNARNPRSDTLQPVIDKTLTSRRVTLLFFYAEWCHFCTLQKSIVEGVRGRIFE